MDPCIHIISDLHLSQEQPEVFRLFKHYIEQIAPQSDSLYILGDLFEVWIGDDYLPPFNQQIIELLKGYSNLGKNLFIQHGNRDFLLGEVFACSVGAILLKDIHQLSWNGKTITLMHGDTLCTDDSDYQAFRSMVRNNSWQSQFLAMPIEQRLAIACDLRQKSKQAQKGKTLQIMDVNPQAVKQCFNTNPCNWLIHGHTHRQARHRMTLTNGQAVERMVLSDWQSRGHYLELSGDDCLSHYFTLWPR